MRPPATIISSDLGKIFNSDPDWTPTEAEAILMGLTLWYPDYRAKFAFIGKFGLLHWRDTIVD